MCLILVINGIMQAVQGHAHHFTGSVYQEDVIMQSAVPKRIPAGEVHAFSHFRIENNPDSPPEIRHRIFVTRIKREVHKA
ncbi:hypothetical protein D3C76_1363290 [compost metagenome]